MISSKQPKLKTTRRSKKKSSLQLAKGPLACLRLIQFYESQAGKCCYLNHTKIGELLNEYGHKKVVMRQVERYFSLLKTLGLIICRKPNMYSSYNTNTTELAKLYLSANICKQSEVQKYENKNVGIHTLIPNSLESGGERAHKSDSDAPSKITNAHSLTSKVGFLTGSSVNSYSEYTSLKDNKCKLTSNIHYVNGKIERLVDTSKGDVMSTFKTNEPKKAIDTLKMHDNRKLDLKQMLEYAKVRQDQYDASFMERNYAQRKEKWESYKQANQYNPEFDKFEHEKKMKRKEWERMMEESRITNEKIKSTKESLAEMEKQADENRPSNEFVQSKMAQMKAMLQPRKET